VGRARADRVPRVSLEGAGLLVLKSGLARADEVFHLTALVITGSILARSSTDVLVARWIQATSQRKEKRRNLPDAPARD